MAFQETALPSQPSLGNKAAQYLRQYGKVPQTLADNNVPAVSSATNIGTGGGAGMSRFPTNGANGNIDVYLGRGFSQTMSLDITFPATPPDLFWSCNFGTFAVSTEDDLTYTLTFSAVTGIARSQPYKISYQPITAR